MSRSGKRRAQLCGAKNPCARSRVRKSNPQCSKDLLQSESPAVPRAQPRPRRAGGRQRDRWLQKRAGDRHQPPTRLSHYMRNAATPTKARCCATTPQCPTRTTNARDRACRYPAEQYPDSMSFVMALLVGRSRCRLASLPAI